MKKVLLEQLSSSDLQWLKTHGHQQQVREQNVLIEKDSQVDYLYLLLRGELTATITKNQGRLGRVFAALEEEGELEQEIASFVPGDILGEMSFLDVSPSATTVRAAENSLVLAIPAGELKMKISEDFGFASRFYRFIAILLHNRFGNLVKLFLRRKEGQIPPLKDVPLIFGELSDSDVDWMLSSGRLEERDIGEILIPAQRQVEHLYVVLQGVVSVSVSEEKEDPLSSLFAILESDEDTEQSPQRELARISRGEIIGEIAALDNPVSSYTCKTLEKSILLNISRQKLLIKLQQDTGMAARFYRVVAMLLSGRLQSMISRLGYGRSSYEIGSSLSDEIQYEDEIDLETMDNLTLGGARFDWMLRRLRVS